MITRRMHKNILNVMRFWILSMLIIGSLPGLAQNEQQWEEGDLEDVEIEIIKERQIILPKASRNFEKIPPKASEPIKAPIQYNFRSFSVLSAQANPVLRPLRLKQEDPSKIYGGYVSAGYGNYASPYVEGFINTTKNKNKLVGAHVFHRSFGKGPVEGKQSASGASSISAYANSFSENFALSADARFDTRDARFYGNFLSDPTVELPSSHQRYNDFRISGSVSNARSTNFSYKLGAAFDYLADAFDASETEVEITFNSTFKLKANDGIGLKAGYVMLSRKDAEIETTTRSLLNINPTYVFYPIDDLRVSAGVVASFENDTIDSKDIHAYPDFSASYPISPSVNAIATLTGGVEKVSLHTLSKENIWIGPNIPIFHTNKLYDFQVALYTKVGNKVAVNGGFSLASLKNWYFFRAYDGRHYTPEYDRKGVERLNFFASLGYAQTEAAKVMVRGDWYTYATDEVDVAFNRPTYRVTGEASFNIYEKILLDFNVIAQGGTKIAKDLELDPAVDVNARTEYVVSDSFSVFVELNNILNKEYQVYQYYPVRGLQVLGGLTWSF